MNNSRFINRDLTETFGFLKKTAAPVRAKHPLARAKQTASSKAYKEHTAMFKTFTRPTVPFVVDQLQPSTLADQDRIYYNYMDREQLQKLIKKNQIIITKNMIDENSEIFYSKETLTESADGGLDEDTEREEEELKKNGSPNKKVVIVVG